MLRIILATTMTIALGLASHLAVARDLAPAASATVNAIAVETGFSPQITGMRHDGLPRLVAGQLTRPSSRPATDIARDFVFRKAALFAVGVDEIEVLRETGHAVGHTVRFAQTYDGLPVIGSALAVYVRDDGVVRAVASSLENLGLLDTEPAVESTAAAHEARLRAGWFVPRTTDFHSRLVILALPNQGRLAWEIHFGALPGLLSNLWFYVDAQTGELIRKENRIVFQYQGRVFESNPGPFQGPYTDPIVVDLDIPDGGFFYTEPDYDPEMIPTTACDYDAGIDAGDCDCPGGECVWLSHPLHLSRNCPDYHLTIPLDLSSFLPNLEVDAHFCTEAQTAFADADGQFFYSWEGDHYGLDDLNPNDKFAEVQMFHIVSEAYAYFQNLMDDHDEAGTYDWQGLSVMPLMATVNFKIPVDPASMTGNPNLPEIIAQASDPYGELFPFDNAFFMSGDEEGFGVPGFSKPYDSIVFGQGSLMDFGWDGDVIRHELTHAVDNSVTGGGTASFSGFGDEWGVNPEPGGLSEGYADIFPAFISDEPTMGEYSLAAFGEGSVRDLSGDDVCPDYLEGEEHSDSPGWSQSVYQAREAAAGADPESRHQFAQAVFIGLSMFVPQTGFAESAASILTAVEDLLGSNASADAAEVFAAHGTDDCPRVLHDGGSGTLSKSRPLATPATVGGVAGDPYTPGIMQFAVTAGESTAAVNMEFNLSTGGQFIFEEQGEAEMQVLVRFGEPIQFSYDGSSVEVDEDVLGPLSMDADNQFSLVATDGGPLNHGEYYLMPVNVGDGPGFMTGISVHAGDPIAEDEGTHQIEGATDDAGTDSGPGAKGDSNGCGCSVPGAADTTSGIGAALLLLLLAGVILRSR